MIFSNGFGGPGVLGVEDWICGVSTPILQDAVSACHIGTLVVLVVPGVYSVEVVVSLIV